MKIKLSFLLALTTMTAGITRADDSQTAARKIFEARKDCVVHVSAIAKTSFTADSSGDAPVNVPDQENKVEALGTVIDPTGLIVTVLGQLDPGRMVSGRSVRTKQGVIKIEAASVLKEIKVIMPDGTEIPAEILMKDTDLNLAFLRIKTASKEAKGVTIHSLNLSDNAKGAIMDDVVTLSRLDEALNRAPNISRGEISAIIKKPRTLIRATGGMGGCPTFLLNGKILGITTARNQPGATTSHAVIIPAADILEIAEQAKNSKPEKTESAKAESAATQADSSKEN